MKERSGSQGGPSRVKSAAQAEDDAITRGLGRRRDRSGVAGQDKKVIGARIPQDAVGRLGNATAAFPISDDLVVGSRVRGYGRLSEQRQMYGSNAFQTCAAYLQLGDRVELHG